MPNQVLSQQKINIEAEKAISDIREKCKALKPKIAVKCLTFNHEKYIRQALDGFISQKTDFPFVVIVHDDASTDKTPPIIAEYKERYPDVFLPIYEKTNQYSKKDGSVTRILNKALEATGAKYVATCEGDDYWIAADKLQKQFDFLESNPDYGLVATNCYKLTDKGFQDFTLTNKEEITTEDLLQDNCIATLTTLYRRDLLDGYQRLNIARFKFPLGDYPLWLFISQKTRIRNLNEYTAVYRILSESASHSSDDIKRFLFHVAFLEIKLLFSKKYPKLGKRAFWKRRKIILYYALKRRHFHLLKYLFTFNYLNNGHSEKNL